MKDISTIGVLGAGTMGRGIAQVCAQNGFNVIWYDINQSILDTGIKAIEASLEKLITRGVLDSSKKEQTLIKFQLTTSIENFRQAHFIIEAVPENLELKQNIFRQISNITSQDVVLATNTSSLSVSKIAAAAIKPEQVIGMHFFNPVPVMRLLEIVKGELTSESALQQTLAISKCLGKETIVVRDSPGFATSRLGLALGLEAMRMIETGVASAEDIDKAMELGYNHPMGPLKLTDLIGLDVRLNIANYLHKTLGSENFRPPKILCDMVEKGFLGKKSGQGFYSWD